MRAIENEGIQHIVATWIICSQCTWTTDSFHTSLDHRFISMHLVYTYVYIVHVHMNRMVCQTSYLYSLLMRATCTCYKLKIELPRNYWLVWPHHELYNVHRQLTVSTPTKTKDTWFIVHCVCYMYNDAEFKMNARYAYIKGWIARYTWPLVGNVPSETTLFVLHWGICTATIDSLANALYTALWLSPSLNRFGPFTLTHSQWNGLSNDSGSDYG